MTLTQEDISEINGKCPSEQGIFTQPYGIPVNVKEPVIYMRWTTGGVTGGSCWHTELRPRPAEEKPKFKALDLTLQKLKPNLSFLQYREVEDLIKTNEDTNEQYYGNSTEFKVEYIQLSELEEYLKNL